ncbi:hypothetical protein CBL_02268 [Carabus blaptoides fortunei]
MRRYNDLEVKPSISPCPLAHITVLTNDTEGLETWKKGAQDKDTTYHEARRTASLTDKFAELNRHGTWSDETVITSDLTHRHSSRTPELRRNIQIHSLSFSETRDSLSLTRNLQTDITQFTEHP